MNKGSIVERLCSDLDRKEPRYKSPTLLYICATQLRCGDIFSKTLLQTFYKMCRWKNLKSVNIWRRYMDKNLWLTFLAHPVDCINIHAFKERYIDNSWSPCFFVAAFFARLHSRSQDSVSIVRTFDSPGVWDPYPIPKYDYLFMLFSEYTHLMRVYIVYQSL